MSSPLLPVCRPLLAGNELQYVAECIRTGWISSTGKFVAQFEECFASYLAMPHAVTASSGTAALHMAYAAAGLGPGDEVLMPSFTMVATAFAACYTGAMPVFVDCDPETWTIDPARVEEKITPRSRALVTVPIYGHPCEMGPLMALARKHGLIVIEDAAEAIGSEYEGRMCGTFGDLGCFSFFANKTITSGEGGMVVTASKEMAEACRSFKNLCFSDKGGRVFVHEHIGYNYRLSNLLAAVGLAQLERVVDYVAMRRANARRYTERLKGVPGLVLPVERPWAKNTYWMYGIRVEEQSFGETRERMMARLREHGIETRPFFTPMHRQPSLQRYGCNCEGEWPASELLAKTGFYLPSSTDLTEIEIDRVCETLLLGRQPP
jgi:perosamine synthetase